MSLTVHRQPHPASFTEIEMYPNFLMLRVTFAYLFASALPQCALS
jgi:hypothetical protein